MATTFWDEGIVVRGFVLCVVCSGDRGEVLRLAGAHAEECGYDPQRFLAEVERSAVSQGFWS
jgi:hypothetical protein